METENPSACATVSCNWCNREIALCYFGISVIKSKCIPLNDNKSELNPVLLVTYMSQYIYIYIYIYCLHISEKLTCNTAQ
jgi:hypothetical protein